MRLKLLLLATLGMWIVPCVSGAQDHEPLKPGARVRLTAPALGRSPIVGMITFADSDSLRFRPFGDHTTDRSIGRGDLTRAWISEGSRSRVGEGLLIGAGVGVVVGLIIVTTNEPAPTGNVVEDVFSQAFESTFDALEVVVIGGAGLLLGGAIGLAVRTDKWREIPLGARVGFIGDHDSAVPAIVVSMGF